LTEWVALSTILAMMLFLLPPLPRRSPKMETLEASSSSTSSLMHTSIEEHLKDIFGIHLLSMESTTTTSWSTIVVGTVLIVHFLFLRVTQRVKSTANCFESGLQTTGFKNIKI
jgi:hypothetical protein